MPEAPVADPAVQAAPPVAPDVGADTQTAKFEVPENVSKLLENLGMVDGDATPGADPAKPKDDKPKDAPKPRASASPDPKPARDGAPAPTPEERPITVRQPKLERPALPVVETPKPQPAASTEFKPDPAWEQSLEDNEREILDDAREAERLFPDKYKGLAARTAKFIREHTELTKKEEFDDQDPKYRQWLQANQPKLTRKEIRDIEEARVSTKLRGEYDGKFNDLKHTMFVREQEPRVQAEGHSMFAELTHSAVPEDIAKAIKEQGIDKARETLGLEIDTAQTVLSVATGDIVEFKRITTKDPETGRPLQAVMEKPPVGNPDDPAFQRETARYQQHERLSKLVAELNDSFKTNAPAKDQLRNGRWFVTRDEMAQIKPDQRHRFWTFTNAELIERAKANVPAAVRQAIEMRREQMKKLGWVPPSVKAAAPAKPVDQPPPVPTNAARTPAPAPVPGNGDVPLDVDERAKRLAAQLGRG